MKVLKSAGSALGGDEIDSECRTEDDEDHNMSGCIEQLDKQSK